MLNPALARRMRGPLSAMVALASIVAIAPYVWSDSSASLEPNVRPATTTASLDDLDQALVRRNEALELALADALAHLQPDDPLLVPRLVSARVLGSLARQWLSRADTLDAGSDASVAVASLVLADTAPPLVDRGSEQAVAADQLLLVGRSVWGSVTDVGRRTSRARRITDPQYRGIVRLARLDDDHAIPGPRGLIEGDGNGRCRVRLVETTHPVSVGDWAIAAGLEGFVDVPIVYGRVTQAERQPGAAHWEIVVEPTAAGDTQRVAILTAKPSAAP